MDKITQAKSQEQKKVVQQPLKIRQFQWYQVQTKVRQIMGEILQPFNKKQTQQTVRLNQIKRNLALLTKKQQEHSYLLEQEGVQKPKYLQLQDEKIDALQKKIIDINMQTQGKVYAMQNILKIYQQKIIQLNALQTKVDEQIKERIKQMAQFEKNNDEKTTLMMTKIQSQNDEINTIRGHTRNSINKLEIKLNALQNKTRQHEDQLKRKTNQIKRLNQNSLTITQKIIKVQLKSIDLDERLIQRQKDSKMSQKFFAIADDLKNDIGFIQGYLQRYQPLYTQIIISDTLNSFLKGRQKKLLSLYEQQIYARLHQVILNDNTVGLQHKMAQYSDRIRHVINRNKKYVIGLKVQRTIRLGKNVYEIRLVDDDNQQAENAAKPINFIIPQADMMKVIQKKWSDLIPKLKSQVSSELQPCKVWIQQLQDQFVLRTAKNEQIIERITNKINSLTADHELNKGFIDKQIKQIDIKIHKYSKMYLSLTDSVKDIINFGSVINHIVIQDQIDRQGLALYALKGQNNSPELQKISPTIHLDPKCQACTSGASSIVNQAFKLACLAYNPSQIKIDDQAFSRQQILEVSTNILEKMKEKVQKLIINHIQPSPQTQRKFKHQGKRSQSQFTKDINHKTGSINVSKTIQYRNKQMQTLLPVLASSKKSKFGHGDRSTQFSLLN